MNLSHAVVESVGHRFVNRLTGGTFSISTMSRCADLQTRSSVSDVKAPACLDEERVLGILHGSLLVQLFKKRQVG